MCSMWWKRMTVKVGVSVEVAGQGRAGQAWSGEPRHRGGSSR